MRTSAIRRWDRETVFVAQVAACVSFLSFLFYLRHGELMLYGDAVAHINIARRVFDSRTPGLLQLGTVWLPLPHLVMVPFLLSGWMWQTGIGASIPSMMAYVLGTVGIFRLVRVGLSFYSEADGASRVAAWLAAGIYAANPNLIYLQSTAMTEPLYLALFIWAVVHFSEFVQETSVSDERTQHAASLSLVKSGCCLMAASLTRYDGWFLTTIVSAAVIPVMIKARRHHEAEFSGFKKFILLAAAAPALWIGYNAVVYRNPTEFANGPYSAKAIAQKNSLRVPHPGSNDLSVAFSFFLKAAELNVAPGLAEGLGWSAVCWDDCECTVQSAQMGASAAVDAGSVLHAFDRLRRGAGLRSVLVAIFLLQRALWFRVAARIRRICSSHWVLPSGFRQKPGSRGDRGASHGYVCLRQLCRGVVRATDLFS